MTEMNVSTALNMSLDDIIKGASQPKRAAGAKPQAGGKKKVTLARSARLGAQGTQNGAVKAQGRQAGRQALAVQRSLKPKGGVAKRTVVTITNNAAQRRVVASATPNVAVTIRNAQATRQPQQRPLQGRLGRPRPSQSQPVRGLANQGARQAPAPAHGYGPRNLLPRSEYGGAGPSAAAPLSPAPLRRQPQRGAGGAAGNVDFGVSRRMLGDSLASGRRLTQPQQRQTQMLDYDNTTTGLRMDYRR